MGIILGVLCCIASPLPPFSTGFSLARIARNARLRSQGRTGTLGVGFAGLVACIKCTQVGGAAAPARLDGISGDPDVASKTEPKKIVRQVCRLPLREVASCYVFSLRRGLWAALDPTPGRVHRAANDASSRPHVGSTICTRSSPEGVDHDDPGVVRRASSRRPGLRLTRNRDPA